MFYVCKKPLYIQTAVRLCVHKTVGVFWMFLKKKKKRKSFAHIFFSFFFFFVQVYRMLLEATSNYESTVEYLAPLHCYPCVHL